MRDEYHLFDRAHLVQGPFCTHVPSPKRNAVIFDAAVVLVKVGPQVLWAHPAAPVRAKRFGYTKRADWRRGAVARVPQVR